MLAIFIASLIKLAIILGFALNVAGLLTWLERRQSAMMQDRLGPVRANIGPLRLFGLLHPIADAVKMFTKEDFIPPHAKKSIFLLAPAITLLPALLVFAVIPFGPPACLSALTEAGGSDAVAKCLITNPEHMQVAHVDIGLLFVFAIGSLGVYGAALAGWASVNNYGLLGGMRASAQMLSYEIAMGMAIIGAFLVYGTLEPEAMVMQQQSFLDWGVFRQPLGFILFFVAAIAETKRAPFDIPEGESEVVGYFVEYSGSRFLTFMLAEFVEIVFVGCIITVVFFGGWHLPGVNLDSLPHWLGVAIGITVFFVKSFIFCFLQMAIRWTLPRLRYDQLMKLGWKGMLPASIINVVLTAGAILAAQALG